MEHQDSRTRNVTKKEVITAIVVVSFLLAVIIIRTFYSARIGNYITVAFATLGFLALILTPRQQWHATAQALKHKGHSPYKKAVLWFEYAIVIIVLFCLVKWLIQK